MQTWVETFAAAAGAFLFVLVCVLLLEFSAVYYKLYASDALKQPVASWKLFASSR